jgi:hypothetical protein
MDETSMIERVARAMLAAHDHTTNDGAVGGFETMTPDWQEVYRAMARASVEAMREPSSVMVWTGASYLDAAKDEGTLLLVSSAYTAMIDAVLREN